MPLGFCQPYRIFLKLFHYAKRMSKQGKYYTSTHLSKMEKVHPSDHPPTGGG